MTELFREHYDEDALRAIPTLTLAHVGDSVYELLARSAVAARGGCRVEDAHRQTVALVSAPAQARAAEALLPLLAPGCRVWVTMSPADFDRARIRGVWQHDQKLPGQGHRSVYT